MRNEYIVIEVNETDFMAVTKAQNKLCFKTRPVGHYKFLIVEMKLIAESICNISKFTNPYLLQVL